MVTPQISVRRSTPFIEPVSQKPDALLLLNTYVLKKLCGGNTCKFVPVNEDRHSFPPERHSSRKAFITWSVNGFVR